MTRDPHAELIIALSDYLGPLDIISAKTRDWASATFVGMHHELEFTCAASSVLIDALPDVDLPMRAHFVADLKTLSVSPADAGYRIAVEALTISHA